MSSTGQADVVYRVVHEETGRTTSIPLLRPGDVIEDVRVAHFNGETWSSLGTINRNPGISMRAADADERPADRRSGRPATGWSFGRSRTSTGSRASGRDASSGARSAT